MTVEGPPERIVIEKLKSFKGRALQGVYSFLNNCHFSDYIKKIMS
jgi:hypothetical protein